MLYPANDDRTERTRGTHLDLEHRGHLFDAAIGRLVVVDTEELQREERLRLVELLHEVTEAEAVPFLARDQHQRRTLPAAAKHDEVRPRPSPDCRRVSGVAHYVARRVTLTQRHAVITPRCARMRPH